MKTKVLISVLILGIIFFGSSVFAIMNGGIIINSHSSDLDNNFTDIQNQSSLTKDIDSLNNTNLISFSISESYDYINYQNKNKKELLFDYIEKNGVNEYFYILHRDSNNLNSGYTTCFECGRLIPIGNVSNLIPEEYLCNCSNIVSSSAIPMYSEENVLNHIYFDIILKNETLHTKNKNTSFYSSHSNVSLNNQSSITESPADVVNSSNENSDVDVRVNPRPIPVYPHYPTAEDLYKFGERHRNQTTKISI